MYVTTTAFSNPFPFTNNVITKHYTVFSIESNVKQQEGTSSQGVFLMPITDDEMFRISS
jgi:hypothetical protein